MRSSLSLFSVELEKSERRRSNRNTFLACSFSAARVVLSGEANAYFLLTTASRLLFPLT